MARQRAYLLPEIACPVSRLDICISIPNDLGHIMPFLAQVEHLANWYAWERDEAHTNDDVAACWRDVFDALRHSIDEGLGCGVTESLRDVRMVDCVLEKQAQDGTWSEIGSVAACADTAIDNAIASGHIPASGYPTWPEPQLNATNDTMRKMACGIADFVAEYMADKFGDQLDLIESLVTAGLTVAKIAADVVAAVLGFTQVAGGAIDAIKDLTEGSISVGFAVVRAADTVEWRSAIKCDLYNRLVDNGGVFGDDKSPVITGWKSYIASRADAISPLFVKLIDAVAIEGFNRWAKIAENNEGECDDCVETWCFQFLNGRGLGASPFNLYAIANFGTTAVYDSGADDFYTPDAAIDRAYRTIEAHINLASASGFTITEVQAFVESVAVGGVPSNLRSQILIDGVERGFRTQLSTFSGVDNYTITATGLMLTDPDDIMVYLESAKYPETNHSAGSLHLTKVIVRGTGVSPFGADNCA